MAKPASRFAEIDAQLSVKRTGCSLCMWLDTQPAEDRDYLNALMSQPVKVKGHMHVQQVIVKGGDPKFDPKTISSHRTNHLSQ